MIFKDVWHNVFRVKRQIINSQVCWEFIFQSCYTRIALGWIRYSTALVLKTQWTARLWRNGQLSIDMNLQTKCCLIVWTRCTFSAAPGRSFIAGVGENCEDCCCEQVEDNDWMTGGIKCLIQHWLHISPNRGLRSHVRFKFLTLKGGKKIKDFFFSNEIWWFNS